MQINPLAKSPAPGLGAPPIPPPEVIFRVLPAHLSRLQSVVEELRPQIAPQRFKKLESNLAQVRTTVAKIQRRHEEGQSVPRRALEPAIAAMDSNTQVLTDIYAQRERELREEGRISTPLPDRNLLNAVDGFTLHIRSNLTALAQALKL